MSNLGKGFFGKEEGILLISSNYAEKQKIEDGLNRTVTIIRSVNDLISVVSDLTGVDNTINASVIITAEMPKDVRAGIEDVVDYIETSEMPAFEIAVGETVKGATRFGTIEDFITYSKQQKRKGKISEVTNKEQRTILEELQNETEVQRVNISELNEEKAELQETIKELEGKYTTLNTEVETVYKVQLENAQTRLRDVEEQLEELNRMLEVEKNKSEAYRKEKDEALGDLTSNRFTLQSLRDSYSDKQAELRKTERKLEISEETIDKLVKEKEDIIRTRVNSEDHVLLSNELDKERDRYKQLEEKVVKMRIDNEKTKHEKELLAYEIEQYREGNESIEQVGRTLKLDEYRFEHVDLVYIKVIDELPYLKLAVQMFFDKLSQKYENNAHLMILKNDDGLDSQVFENVELRGKLKDVKESDRVFRLFPNPVMFTGASAWENKVGLIVVVDYIKNNTYYLTSRARERYMTVVRREEDKDKYKLKGSAICIQGNSVYDIKHDPRISGSGLKANRHRIVEMKVNKWLENIM